MKKKNKILIASTRDWCTIEIAKFYKNINNNTSILLISGDRSWGDIKLNLFLTPFRLLYKFIYKPYYLSHLVKIENLVFDLLICILIFIYRPKMCILWSNMSHLSLLLCNKLKINSVLYIGEEYLKSSKNRGVIEISNYWINNSYKEILAADTIIVESSFVKNSIPINFHNKILIVTSPINDLFRLNNVKRDNVNNIIKVGIISSSTRKNTKFVISILEILSTDHNFELHVFGDASFFTNTILTQINFKIIIHPYIKLFTQNDLIKYIEELSIIDIYLFPSLSDGGPRSLIEVSMLGISIVCSPNTIGPDLSKYCSNIKTISLDINLWVLYLNSYIENFNRDLKIKNKINNSIITNKRIEALNHIYSITFS